MRVIDLNNTEKVCEIGLFAVPGPGSRHENQAAPNFRLSLASWGSSWGIWRSMKARIMRPFFAA